MSSNARRREITTLRKRGFEYRMRHGALASRNAGPSELLDRLHWLDGFDAASLLASPEQLVEAPVCPHCGKGL
jgi:hypothetical protein